MNKKIIAIIIVLYLVLSVFPLRKVSAQNTECGGWKEINNGLYGGKVFSLAIDPQHTNIIYAGTEDGVYKSTDGGKHWNKTELTNVWVDSIIVNPSNPNIVYVITSVSGVFKSTDRGKSWKEINNRLYGEEVYSLAIDPQNTNVIYAGTQNDVGTKGEIFKSTDGGKSWKEVCGECSGPIVIDPKNPNIIYAIGGGIFKSTDGGKSWKEINNGIDYVYVYCIALNPKNTNIIYATEGSSVYKSTDGGESWKEINNGLPHTNFLFLVIDSHDPNIIYAGTDSNGILKSTDGGKSWKEVNNGLLCQYTTNTIKSIVIDPQNTNVIYAGTDGCGVFKSTDGGESWKEVNNGLINLCVNSLAIDPQNTNTIYAGTEGGVFKSTDGGESWYNTSKGLTNANVHSIAIDPQNSNIIYAGTEGGVFKSTDGGESWYNMNISYNAVFAIAIDPKDTSNVYFGTKYGIFKNYWYTDAYPDSKYACYSLAIDPQNTNTIYAGTEGGVFKSTDGGESWYNTSKGLTNANVHSIAIDPQNSNIIYAGTEGGVFKSTDGGESWKDISYKAEESIVIDPKNPNIIYTGGWGVYKSADAGKSWEDIRIGLTSLFIKDISFINCLAIDPKNTNVIYAGTWDSGVFKCSSCIPFTPPSPPQHLTAAANSANKSITLMWQPSTQGTYQIAGYAIYRGTSSWKENSTPIGTVDANTTTYTDTNLSPGTYYYYVKAFDNQNPPNYSYSSNEVSATLKSTPPPNSVSDNDIDGDGKKDLQANTGNSYVKVETTRKADVVSEAGTPDNTDIVNKVAVSSDIGNISLYSTSSPTVLENSDKYLLYEITKVYKGSSNEESLTVKWDTIIPKDKDYWVVMAQIENTGKTNIDISSISNLLLFSVNNPKKLLIPDVVDNEDISSIANGTSFSPTVNNSIVVEYNENTVAALGYIPPWSSAIKSFTISGSDVYSKTLLNSITPGETRYWQGILIANSASSILQRHIPYSTLLSSAVRYKEESDKSRNRLSVNRYTMNYYGDVSGFYPAFKQSNELSAGYTSYHPLQSKSISVSSFGRSSYDSEVGDSRNVTYPHSNLVTIHIQGKDTNTTLSVTYTDAEYAALVSQSITDIMNDAKKNFINILGALASKLTPFTDIGQTFISGATVVLQRFGIVKGYPSKEVKLENNITRAEYVTEVDKMMHFTLISPSTPTFKDVSPGKWYYPYIETAASHKIVNGYPDKTFRPANSITKAESITVISNLLSIFYNPSIPSFKDVPKSFWGYKYIEGALLKSIIEKKPPIVFDNVYFKPNIPAMRGVTNFFIYRALYFECLNG